MERSICPICHQKNLIPAKEVRTGKTVCENEHYRHIQAGHFHYLVRTKKNIIEEVNPQLVTN